MTEFDNFVVTTTPEPSTLVLLVVGAISLLGYAWRRLRKLHRLSSMLVVAVVALTAAQARAETIITSIPVTNGGFETGPTGYVNLSGQD